jgi:SAM-dependent methyltransferase
MTASDASAAEREYVLGTNDQELVRLGLQHQIWRGVAYEAWERAGFVPGMRLLDVGSGPGYTTADLAELAGPAGHVTAVDISQRFVAFLRSRNLTNVEVLLGDVQEMGLPAEHFDGAYSRWVMCYLPHPQRVIERVARALKPGARFVVQDYFNYTGVMLAPRSEAFQRVIAAVQKSWREKGGDTDFGCRLPDLFARAGLRVTDVRPLVRIGRPHELLWRWPDTFFRIFVPALVKQGYLTESDHRAFQTDWEQHSHDPNAFFASPPMVEVIGEKS